MAVLSDSDRRDVWSEWMQDNAANVSVTKADIRAAVDALDSFMSTNAAAVNSAIPQPARGSLTAAQKARLLVFVISRRWLRGA